MIRIIIGCSLVCLIACGGEEVFSPKPRMFPRVDYPERNYTDFKRDYCQLTFNYPDYAQVIQDTLFFDEKPADPCWFDLVFPQFNGRLHVSYYPISEDQQFDDLLKDAFEFVNKHDIKANYRDEIVITNEAEKNGGVIFEINGPVASPLQFFVTDSVEHFMRGSLYFNNQVNPDSMAPIYQYVIEDVKKVIGSVRFDPTN